MPRIDSLRYRPTTPANASEVSFKATGTHRVFNPIMYASNGERAFAPIGGEVTDLSPADVRMFVERGDVAPLFDFVVDGVVIARFPTEDDARRASQSAPVLDLAAARRRQDEERAAAVRGPSGAA